MHADVEPGAGLQQARKTIDRLLAVAAAGLRGDVVEIDVALAILVVEPEALRHLALAGLFHLADHAGGLGEGAIGAVVEPPHLDDPAVPFDHLDTGREHGNGRQQQQTGEAWGEQRKACGIHCGLGHQSLRNSARGTCNGRELVKKPVNCR
ncbi:hypothetical protein D3C87_1690010 [compost metagenome]